MDGFLSLPLNPVNTNFPGSKRNITVNPASTSVTCYGSYGRYGPDSTSFMYVIFEGSSTKETIVSEEFVNITYGGKTYSRGCNDTIIINGAQSSKTFRVKLSENTWTNYLDISMRSSLRIQIASDGKVYAFRYGYGRCSNINIGNRSSIVGTISPSSYTLTATGLATIQVEY